MLQREIRLKEVQDATYDDMCRLLNERKLCNTSTTLMILRTKLKLRLMVKMSCSSLMKVTEWALKQLGRNGILSSPTVLNKESKW